MSFWVTSWDKKLLIIPRLWGSMVAAATAATAVTTAAATGAATATFVKSQLSLQVLKRLLSLLVCFRLEAIQEAQLLASCAKSDSITRLYAYATTDSQLFLYMERCLCSLRDILTLKKEESINVSLGVSRSLMKQILDGVEFLHSNQISHRDLKVSLYFRTYTTRLSNNTK